MSPGIFVIREGDELVEMSIQPYETEDVLQKLLEDYPGVLAGEGRTSGGLPTQAAGGRLHQES